MRWQSLLLKPEHTYFEAEIVRMVKWVASAESLRAPRGYGEFLSNSVRCIQRFVAYKIT